MKNILTSLLVSGALLLNFSPVIAANHSFSGHTESSHAENTHNTENTHNDSVQHNESQLRTIPDQRFNNQIYNNSKNYVNRNNDNRNRNNIHLYGPNHLHNTRVFHHDNSEMNYINWNGRWGFWFPSGTTEIFINANDNNCQYWNGSGWTVLVDNNGYFICLDDF